MNSRRVMSTIAAVALTCAAAPLLAGCGGTATAAGGMTVVHVDALPVVDDAPFYLALKRGWFRQAGLDVRASMATTSAVAFPRLVSGATDVVAGSNWVSMFKYAVNGGPIRVLADGYASKPTSNAVVALRSSHIRGLKDLYGKKVAFSLTKSITTITFAAAMRANGADPSKVDQVQVPFTSMAEALDNHSVTAAYMVEPFVTMAETKGARIILDPTGKGPTANFPMSGYATSTTFVTKHRRAAAAFRRVIQRAQAATGRSQVEQLLPTYTKLPRKTAAMITIGTYPTSVDAHRLQRVADLMLREHLLKKKLDVATLIVDLPTSTASAN